MELYDHEKLSLRGRGTISSLDVFCNDRVVYSRHYIGLLHCTCMKKIVSHDHMTHSALQKIGGPILCLKSKDSVFRHK